MTHSLPPASQQPWPSSRELDPVVAAITHELRTPLQAIIGFGQLAQMDWPAGVDRRYLLQIEQASRLMLRVVNDLLDLSHLENGRLDIDPDQPLNPYALCSSVLSTADSLRQDKPVRLYAQVAPDCPGMLRGDGKRIEQILLNLMANAIRFTDRGEVVLQVRVLRQGPQGVTLRLAVADTGVGLSPGELALMTEPPDGGGGPARRRGGAGFGLNIVRRLLELHGSRLQAASVQGGGTLVWFDLHLMRDAAAPAPARPVGPQTVLCTDDPRLFETVRTQWAAMGLRLQRASAPHEALADGLWLVDAMRRDLGAWGEVARQAGVRLLAVSALPVAGDRVVASLPQLPVMALDHDTDDGAARGLPLHGMRVLLVEDTLLNQRALSALMARMGAHCEVAGTAALARDMLQQGPWDAALLDVHLPDQGGLMLARWLREQPALADLPFAILSAHVTEDERLSAHLLGAHDCLLKPIEPAHLCRVLASMRRGSGQATPPPTAGAAAVTEAAVAALAGLDIRQLFREEWPALQARLLQAAGHEARRSAIHAIRGNLALLGGGAVWRKARQLEEALLAGQAPAEAEWQRFVTDVDAFVGLSPPNPGR